MDKEFDEAEEKKITYVRERNSNVLNEDKRQHTLLAESTKNQLLSIRKAEEAAFTSIFNNITKIIK